MSATFFIVSLIAGSSANAWGPRVVITLGMTLTGTGLLILAAIGASDGYWPIAAALFPVGIGLGLITGPIATVAVANAPAARSGMSSGLVNVGRMVGATLGVAFLGLMFGPRMDEAAKNAPHWMSMSFMIGAGSQFLGAVIALTWVRRDSLQTRAHHARGVSDVARPKVQRRKPSTSLASLTPRLLMEERLNAEPTPDAIAGCVRLQRQGLNTELQSPPLPAAAAAQVAQSKEQG